MFISWSKRRIFVLHLSLCPTHLVSWVFTVSFQEPKTDTQDLEVWSDKHCIWCKDQCNMQCPIKFQEQAFTLTYNIKSNIFFIGIPKFDLQTIYKEKILFGYPIISQWSSPNTYREYYRLLLVITFKAINFPVFL